MLQALARQRLLSRFDYLSTVSGGGYIGAWLSAWVVRVGGISKVEEELSRTGTPVAPIEFLRSYSNYLTPRTGVFGVDTWTAIATWMRNFSPNMLIVIASMWSVLALIMIVALTASRFELVLGTYAALLLFVAICSVTLGVTLDVNKDDPIWKDHPKLQRFVSSGIAQQGAIVALPLAFAGGGFWWISWGPATVKDDFGGVLLGVILIGGVLWIASFLFTRYINKLAKKRAQRTAPDFLSALKADRKSVV